MDITQHIRTVPDYPVEGINFYDVNSLFADQQLFSYTVKKLIERIRDNTTGMMPTHIVGLESRGFVLGAAIAHATNLPFVMIRKKGAKYPGKLLEQSYTTEYSTDTIVLQDGLLSYTDRVVIVDDLLATGGSMMASRNLVEQTGAKVVAEAVIIDLQYAHSDNYQLRNLISLEKVYNPNA